MNSQNRSFRPYASTLSAPLSLQAAREAGFRTSPESKPKKDKGKSPKASK